MKRGRPRLYEWPPARDAELIRLHDAGEKFVVIALELGVPYHAIDYRLRLLRAEGRLGTRPPRWRAAKAASKAPATRIKWTRARDAELIRLHGRGLAVKRIAAQIGVTEPVIVNRLVQLREQGRIGRRQRSWSAGELASLLRARERGTPYRTLAAVYGVTERALRTQVWRAHRAAAEAAMAAMARDDGDQLNLELQAA